MCRGGGDGERGCVVVVMGVRGCVVVVMGVVCVRSVRARGYLVSWGAHPQLDASHLNSHPITATLIPQ